MNITDERLGKLINETINAAMSVLTVGLPEFSESSLEDLKEEIEIHLEDLIDSHIAALTKDEYIEVEVVEPFGAEE